MGKYIRVPAGHSTLPGRDGGYSKEERTVWVEVEDAEDESAARAYYARWDRADGWVWDGSSWWRCDGTD